MSRRSIRIVMLIATGWICIGCGSRERDAAPATLPVPLAAEVPPQPKLVVRLKVWPEAASLLPGDPGLQMLASSVKGAGDLTVEAKWSVEPAEVAGIDAGGYLKPRKPGIAKVSATVANETAIATVTIENLDERPWNFATDIVPILSRSGCNTGGCHGRAEGQNGFHLSLFGYDAEGDYDSLTRNDGGRRFSGFEPRLSLFLQKASGTIPHVGGPRIQVGSEAYQTLAAWIAAGAPRELGKTHERLTKVTVEPSEVRLEQPGAQQLRVLAHFADGHTRDVTRLASYKVNDDSSASIDDRGLTKLLRRAETDLVVRYGSQVISTRLGTVINPDLSFDFAALKPVNVIDEQLYKRLESLRVPPSPPASDSVFFRRVSLDLTGQQPSPERLREFLKDSSPEKRANAIDHLLNSRDFVRFWQIKFGDLLAISQARLGNGAGRYQGWLAENLSKNTPWDEMVRTLLTALGDPTSPEGGAVNYALDGMGDPKVAAEQTAQRFLGLRFRCAQCHDHPFDVWTQDDYFGLAATFAKVGTAGMAPTGAMMNRNQIKVNPEGKIDHLRTKKPAVARLIGGEVIETKAEEDPRVALAAWMTAADNPFFARAMANWVWAQMFGKGLADPADDLSKANPPVHPELLEALAKRFVANRFDVRDLIRTIALSNAYGASSATVPGNESDIRLFSHQLPRPLTAHQMADALAQATDVANRFPNRASTTRAIEIVDPGTASPILDAFGRCNRTTGCAAVSTPSLSLRQSLLLIGGDVIEGKVAHLNGYLANMLELKPSPDEIIENLYLRTVCRPPTEAEVKHWTTELESAASLREASEDLFWSLLNSREFAFNH